MDNKGEYPKHSQMETNSQNRFERELFLYPIENEFIGNIIISSPKRKFTTIVILDSSHTMDDNADRFGNKILPQVFEKLDYSFEDLIHLITFGDQPNYVCTSVEDFPQMKFVSSEDICMRPAIDILKKILYNEVYNGNRIVRLLSISPGVACDEGETDIACNELASFIKGKLEINSQAVRLLTTIPQEVGYTDALTYVLHLNNMTEFSQLDLEEELSNEEMASAISQLFKDDYLNCQIVLHSEEFIFKKSPWITECSDSIRLHSGENMCWLDKIPTKPVTINESIIQVQIQTDLTLEIYEQLLRLKIEHCITQLKLLKCVDKTVARSTIDNIVIYFQNYIFSKEVNLQIILKNTSVRSEIHYLKELISEAKETFSVRIGQIANDQKVSQLNSAQQAEYLRNINSSKNNRDLARRALRQGIDFNETVRKEVRAMSEHIDELKDVCDKDHEVSFYSKGTTLGGIYTLCELVQKGLLDDLDAKDILLMFNIVGVACSGPIGPFPIPVTWRINELYLGWNVSLSDVLTAFVQSSGIALRTPVTEKYITNVIPVFEDLRIATFLRKYAPSSLEYTCSIGMRRVIADIPMTSSYTICAAVWKMVEALNLKKSEIHLRTFERLVLNYEFFIGNHFEYILCYIKHQGQKNNSYYIGNNGITNMISPLITLYRLNDYKLEFIPDILRALYAYEIWQTMRRLYKKKNNSGTVKAILTKLIGIDVDKNKKMVRPLFVNEPDIKEIHFFDKPVLNETYFAEITKNFYYIDYVTLLPKYFHAVITGNTNTILHIPEVNTETICEALRINYDLKIFLLYNIVQALLFPTKASRIDAGKKVMKITDLKYEQEGQKMVRDYIRKQFENKYLADLALKKRKEKHHLTELLVESIIRACKHDEIIDLMRNGITRGEVHVKIENSSSLGFLKIKQKLVDLKECIPLRANIIKIFLLGKDYKANDAPVWNNGGPAFGKNVSEFEIAFKSTASSHEWDQLYNEYIETGYHLYRTKLNSHGHGNTKQSYWALGYPTLQHYKNNVTQEEFNKYCREHAKCCGVAKFLGIF